MSPNVIPHEQSDIASMLLITQRVEVVANLDHDVEHGAGETDLHLGLLLHGRLDHVVLGERARQDAPDTIGVEF